VSYLVLLFILSVPFGGGIQHADDPDETELGQTVSGQSPAIFGLSSAQIDRSFTAAPGSPHAACLYCLLCTCFLVSLHNREIALVKAATIRLD
jgi:hypothetical protein